VNAASWLTSATIREWDWIEEGRQIWTHHRVMNGCDIRTSRKYTLPQGSAISFPRPDYPHSKLNDAIGGVTFSGRNHLGCTPPITAAESALRPFDFLMGSQFMWQLLGEGSGRRIPLHPAEHNGGFSCTVSWPREDIMLSYSAWWYLVSSSLGSGKVSASRGKAGRRRDRLP
jgi:hypothetical protein